MIKRRDRCTSVAQHATELFFLFKAHADSRLRSRNSLPPLPRERFPGWILPIISVVLLSTLVALILTQDAEIVKIQYAIGQLKSRQTSVLQHRRDLMLEVQRLSALPRIEQMATEKLGLVPANDRLVLEIPAGPVASHEVAVRSLPQERLSR